MTSEPRPSKYISCTTAINRLRQWFSFQPEADSLSVEDIFKISGRENRTDKTNRKWLSDTLLYLKPYHLVKPVYDEANPVKKLLRIQLTSEGKGALTELEDGESTDVEVVNAELLNTEVGGQSPAERTEILSKQVEKYSAPSNIHRQQITVNDLMDIVVKVQRENPHCHITFEIRA